MIVRIATEGQYELDDQGSELHEFDNAAVAACETGDEARFHEAYRSLLDYVRSHGRALGEEDLAPSDVILPPPDVTLVEAQADFSGDGLIPS